LEKGEVSPTRLILMLDVKTLFFFFILVTFFTFLRSLKLNYVKLSISNFVHS